MTRDREREGPNAPPVLTLDQAARYAEAAVAADDPGAVMDKGTQAFKEVAALARRGEY